MIETNAKNAVLPFLEQHEELIWADVPKTKHQWRAIFPFFVLLLLFQLFGFNLIYLSIKGDASGSGIMGIFSICVSLLWFWFAFTEYLTETHQFYAITNTRGLIVAMYDIQYFGILKFKRAEATTINRNQLRRQSFEGDDNIGTLTFTPSVISKIKSSEPIFNTRGQIPPNSFRDIRDPKTVIDLIRIHFIGR